MRLSRVSRCQNAACVLSRYGAPGRMRPTDGNRHAFIRWRAVDEPEHSPASRPPATAAAPAPGRRNTLAEEEVLENQEHVRLRIASSWSRTRLPSWCPCRIERSDAWHLRMPWRSCPGRPGTGSPASGARRGRRTDARGPHTRRTTAPGWRSRYRPLPPLLKPTLAASMPPRSPRRSATAAPGCPSRGSACEPCQGRDVADVVAFAGLSTYSYRIGVPLMRLVICERLQDGARIVPPAAEVVDLAAARVVDERLMKRATSCE